MKHWHQCVKYTLPQCSFQFIFLLVSYVYKKKSSQKERGYKGRPKPVRWLRLTFCHLKPGAGGSFPNTLYKYQLHFLPSQATLHKWCHDKAQRNSCCCSEHSGNSQHSQAQSLGCILNLVPRRWVFAESRWGRPGVRVGPGACHPQLLMPIQTRKRFTVFLS